MTREAGLGRMAANICVTAMVMLTVTGTQGNVLESVPKIGLDLLVNTVRTYMFGPRLIHTAQ